MQSRSSASTAPLSMLGRLLVASALFASGACDKEEPAGPGAPGAIMVTVETTSPTPLFLIEHRVQVGIDSALVAHGSPATFGSLTPGQYNITLSEVPNSCDVLGDGPSRLVSVVDGETVEVRFEIFCVARLRDQIVLDDSGSLWAINPDGSALLRLTNFDPLVDFQPASFSPDGSTLAFSATGSGDGGSNIYTMRFDGSQPTRLTSDPPGDDRGPSWSPDGTQIAYVAVDDLGERVAVINVATRETAFLSNHGDFDLIWNTSWSSLGDQIAFTFFGASTPSEGIGLAFPSGGALALPTLGRTRWASWAPNGFLLAVGHVPAGDTSEQLWIMDTGGSLLEQLTTDAVTTQGPVWSPDGSQIVLQFEPRDRAQPAGAWIMDADGTNKRLLIEGRIPLAWAPQ